MSATILILGGTGEAAALAEKLCSASPTDRVITSLAGRTREPRPVAGEVRVGGFGGPDGLAEFLRTNEVSKLIDATHPFAKQISKNARHAAKVVGVELEVIARPPWQVAPGDQWIEVESLEEARDAIPAKAHVLLALGKQHIAPFASRHDVSYLIRTVDPHSNDTGFKNCAWVTGKPGTFEQELNLLKKHKITHIVCRNSGGPASYTKIEAARALQLPVIIQSRKFE